MSDLSRVDIFVESKLLHSAQKGRHNFLRLVQDVLTEAGLEPNLRYMSERDQKDISEYSLMHMKAPVSARGLVFRCVYHMPFWQIEMTEKRWHWQVAGDTFHGAEVAPDRAERFRQNWKRKLFRGLEATDGDHVYVPLQGRLLERRSFQSCSPIKMMRAVLHGTDRPVVFGLHPRETYTDKELKQVQDLVGRYSHAKLVMGEMEKHLPGCRLLVTQNSSVAFNGYFFDKPAVTLAGIDFHHISTKATEHTLVDAMQSALGARPDYAGYLWWFWQIKSINAGRDSAKAKIRTKFASFGWPVD